MCLKYLFLLENLHVIYYLLGTGESYGLTAQHTQDCPIFFIQLNYVHNNTEIRWWHLVLNFPATRWHFGFHFIFLNSAILHSCIFGHSCLYLLKSLLILDIRQLFLSAGSTAQHLLLNVYLAWLH